MTDPERGPKRLLAEDDPLLQAARTDAPPGDLEGRILAGMGGAPPPTSGGGGVKTFWKIGLGGAIGAGVIVVLTRGTPAPVSSVAVPSTAPTPTTIEPPPTVVMSAPIDAPPAATPPAESAPPPAPIVRSRRVISAPAPSVSAAPALGLGAEIKALDGVRASMNGGDASTALAGLDAYDRAFPQGTLKQEAVLLRIDALMRAGRMEEARKLGHAFLAEHPSTPHRKRILTLLHEGD